MGTTIGIRVPKALGVWKQVEDAMLKVCRFPYYLGSLGFIGILVPMLLGGLGVLVVCFDRWRTPC